MKIADLFRKIKPEPKRTMAPSKDSEFYGGTGTIHHDHHVDVEVYKGKVVGVWFRCMMLPFRQSDWGPQRAVELMRAYEEAERDKTLPQIEAIAYRKEKKV